MLGPGTANTRHYGRFTFRSAHFSRFVPRLKHVRCTLNNIEDLLEVEAPEIGGDLLSIQEKLGAVLQVSLPCAD
jgi:hypothetical protein